MSMFKNLFNKNQQTYNTQPSHLLVDPIYTNASQMNNEFLHHHKPLGWQNSQGLWQSAPLATLPLQQSTPYWQSRGLNRTPYRQIRLRTQNWGTRSENGWSGFNNSRYLNNSWEPQSFLLSELRAQSLSQRGLAAPFNQDLFWNQWQQQRFQSWGSQQRGFNSGFGGLNNGFNGLSLQKPIVAPQQFAQTIVKPVIVQETIRTDRVLQIQPILHREVEQNVINHIEKHITEAPAAHMGGIVRMAPVIQETTQTRVIEEIQPVVHREVAIAQVERVEEHLAERVVAPTQHTNQVVYEAVAPVAPIAPVAAPLVAPIAPVTAPLVAPIAPINSAPLTNTVNITKVVPTGLAGSSPLLLEKQQQAPIVQPAFGSAMM